MTAVLGSIDMGAPFDAMEGALPEAVPAEPEQVVAGRYHIERFLGQGANKRVFLAEDRRLRRHVALAFIRRAAASQATMMRVRREVHHMARVSDHPNIVTVHDVDDDGGRTYIVCQYVAGGSLARHLARLPDHRMPLADALAVAEEITAALAHAHDHAIVHRDLKPGNVFLNDRSEALLGDFGLALARDDVRLTDEYALVGTAPYMAPEQARGHPVDVRSDLYSLGVLLFELLCGRLPFMGKDALEILAKASFQQPRPSVGEHCEVPAELDLLVKRLIAADPAERPSSAAEVRDRLAAMLARAGSVSTSRPKVDQVRLPPALASSRQWPFVGRAEALATLHDNWRQAATGQPSAVFVYGNAGAGKTRLCAQFAQEAHALGATVVYGRCDEEALAPYGPFIQAVRQYATYYPWLPGLVDLPTGFELARLGWPVRGESSRPPPSTGESRDTERYRFFEAAVAMVSTMAGATPLVVIFDDLHWADIPTLRLLRHLVRFVGDGSVMLVCTVRDDEPRPDERREQALGELQREAIVETMRLGGLSRDETAALVEKWAHAEVEPDVIARLCDRTGGNPFYIEETLRTFDDDLAQLRSELAEPRFVSRSVPKRIEALILRRVQPPAISAEALEVLDTAAIIGREFGQGLLAAVLGRSVPDVTDALDEAVRAGLIIEVPGYVDRLAFCHALVRETLLSRQQPSQRMELHARCAEALEARYASSGAHAAELAHHFFEARHDHRDQAMRYTLEAAKWASGALAYEDAVTQQDRALQILDEQGRECDAQRCDLLLARGRALWRAGETEAARDSFASAAEVARKLNDPPRFARAAIGFGRRYYEIDEVDEPLIALLQEALVRVGEGNKGWRARVLAALADALHLRETPQKLQELGREAVRLAREADGDPGALVVALAGLHAALLHIEFLDERLRVNKEMLELIGDGGPPERRAQGLHWQLYNLFELGDMETARREHARLTELAERLRQPIYLHFAAAWQAKWMETAGRFAEAEELALRSLAFAERSHMAYAKSLYAGQLFGLRRDQGRLEKLPDEVREYIGERPRLVVWRAGMLLARLDAGERDRAQQEFESLASRDFRPVPPDFFWLGAMCLLSEACIKLGDRERALVLYRILEPYAARNAQIGLALSVGIVHRFLGGLAAVLERWSAAEAHFDAALKRSAAMDAVTSLAHIRCEYAETLLMRGDDADRARAAAHLTEARCTAERLGMHPLAERAATLESGL
jgi:eukaryotic-like serine/threonine-protein kinase